MEGVLNVDGGVETGLILRELGGITARLNNQDKVLDEIKSKVTETNGKVARHQDWINEQETRKKTLNGPLSKIGWMVVGLVLATVGKISESILKN